MVFSSLIRTFAAYHSTTTMKQNGITLLLIAAVSLLVSVTSCSKEMFDEDVYNESVDYKFMIDNVDRDHDWILTKNDTITISAESNIRSVQVLTENPYASNAAEIAAESVIFGGKVALAYTMPVTMETIYIEAYDASGNDLGYYETKYGTKSIELSTAMLSKPGTIRTTSYQTMTYLYESTFPMPDDFDYNDMVLRISKYNPELGNSFVVDLKVTLQACGADELYAAALQLAGVKYSDIESVEIVGGKRLDEGYPMDRAFINDNVLTEGRHGEAVINLFECAQWALSKEQDDLGDIQIIHYNTSHVETEDKSAIVAPVTAIYRITFKEATVAHSLTFDRLDPFILRSGSTGGIWEVHTYAHKFDSTLKDVNSSAYNNHVSWTIVVPKADFRYTRQGISLCGYNENTGETFGPYLGFVKWMQDHTSNHDWYETLNYSSLVY